MNHWRIWAIVFSVAGGLASSALLSAPTADAWEVYRSHPFVEADADSLAQTLRQPVRRLRLAGPQNDWIHAALAIGVRGETPATVTVRLDGPAQVTAHLQLRVVGFVNRRDGGYSLDPLLAAPGALELSRYQSHVRNLEHIHDFPTVTATPRDPVLLWITADTRDLSAGTYECVLRFADAEGRQVQVPLRLRVLPVALPRDNPLITQGWQWIPSAPTKAEGARLLHEYGINATHLDADMEVARAAGFRFFWFRFNEAWFHAFDEDKEELMQSAQARTAHVQEMIERLDLAPHEWGLYLLDEPKDSTVPNQVQWAEYLRRQWPQVRMVFNPGWGPGPRNEWCSVAGTVEPLLPYADVWMPYSHWLWDDQADRSLPLMKAHAEQVWFYEITDFHYNRRPEIGRGLLRQLAWNAWRYRLQGASWYSLNAADNPWAADPQHTGHGALYGAIPSRALESLREGIQEYKRLYALRDLGVDEATLDEWAERVLTARTVYVFDQVRREMDRELERLARTAGSPDGRSN